MSAYTEKKIEAYAGMCCGIEVYSLKTHQVYTREKAYVTLDPIDEDYCFIFSEDSKNATGVARARKEIKDIWCIYAVEDSGNVFKRMVKDCIKKDPKKWLENKCNFFPQDFRYVLDSLHGSKPVRPVRNHIQVKYSKMDDLKKSKKKPKKNQEELALEDYAKRRKSLLRWGK
jgi:hypothetical protein